ncbi:MAG: hypothetical protein IJJ50_04505 [Lachnospiraceae bacterium]|nr:hypothetical protein [Lachnospiraceae bacterium]
MKDAACREYLESTEYAEGGTLLDLFTMPYDVIDEDITQLYPIVASLSDGQRAGLELLTLEDLVELGITDGDGYKDASYDELETVSIYDGVNRAIYEPGGVGLTSDAIRTRALEDLAVDTNGYLSTLTYAMIGVTAASALAFAVTLGITIHTSRAFKTAVSAIKTCSARVAQCQKSVDSLLKMVNSSILKGDNPGITNYYMSNLMEVNDKLIAAEKASVRAKAFAGRLQAKSSLCNKLSTGIGVALIILVAITTYLSWKDLKDYYKVDYTPIPRYMFGVGAAENINNTLYVWNSSAKSIYAYYKKAAESDVSKAGSVFTAGSLALSGGAGILLGSAASGLLFHVSQKKRRKREEMA